MQTWREDDRHAKRLEPMWCGHMISEDMKHTTNGALLCSLVQVCARCDCSCHLLMVYFVSLLMSSLVLDEVSCDFTYPFSL